jgi:sensor histidine kinase YesM
MRYSVIAISLLVTFFLKAQENYPGNKLPVFKQVTHPFMPSITSEYFFFSQDGLIWFSTAHGLTSFDGSDIIYHSSLQEAGSLGLIRVLAIEEDAKHNFYIGTPTGFYYFDRLARTYTQLSYTFTDNHRQVSPGIYALYLDENGIVYGGTGNGGIFIYDPYKNHLSHYNIDASKPDSWQDIQRNTVISFASHVTDNNLLWLGTYNGIYLLDKKNKNITQNFEIITDRTHKYNPNFNKNRQLIDVHKMDVVNDSIIWFNSWAGGFAKYNSQTGKATIVFGSDALYKAKDLYYGYVIRKFAKLSGDKYLLGINNGKTAVFNTRTDRVEYFNVSGDSYPEEETRYVANDRHGNAWLLQRGFLYVSIPEKLRLQQVNVPNLTALNYNTPKIRGIYFDSSSRLFYGTFLSSAGIHVYDTNFIQQAVLPTSIINNFYNYGSTVDTKITKDGSGRFWTTGWENHVMLPGNKKFELIEKQFPSLARMAKEKDKFTDITTARNGDILIKKNDGSICHINHITLEADTISCPEIKGEGVEINNASAWYDNKRNFVYLTRKGAVAQFSLDKHEMKIIPNASLFGNLPTDKVVCSPALDAAGNIWLMIPQYGIRIIDPVSLGCIDSIQYGSRGLAQGDYTAIIGASDHYMLFRSFNGIVVYNFMRKQSFLFNHSNGLSSPESKAFLYSNGYVFISHSGRFEYFKLSNLDNYSSAITPYLNTIVADTTVVFTRTGFEKKENVKLSYNQNTLSFSFSAPEFFFPERIEYAYRLVPVDNDWHYTNYFNRKIIYSKLSPGTYQFFLKAQMQGGNWDMQPTQYIIIITPAWWQTGWFRLLWIIAAVVLIIFLIQKRIRFIRNREQQKSKHEKELLELEAKALRAQMNPHFIFNSLNSIKSLINKNENDTAAVYLTTFSKLIRTLFQNSDKREISLHEELETCKLYTQLEKMRFGDKVEFIFDIDQRLDLKDIKVPALILQPFIENAIWHGLVPKEDGGKVIVSVKENGAAVECIIDDNGIGRELSRQYQAQYRGTHESKGIGLTQSRLELDRLINEREDTILISDKKNSEGRSSGTTVVITFKENNT